VSFDLDLVKVIKGFGRAKMNKTLQNNAKCALSGWPMAFAWFAMLVFAFHASTHMVGAGDTWVALACGRHFINHGVDSVEPFSANAHKAGPTQEDIKKWPGWAQWITDKVGLETVRYWHPTGWINQNWLTHVIFYWLTTLSPFADADTYSFNTLVYWKFSLYVMAIICVYYTGRLLGANPALSAVFACFSMFVGRSFLDIRPAGYSNLLVAVFLLILVLTAYRNILYIWLIVPLTVFWCNVHGGYIYVFIMLAPFVALHFVTNFFNKKFISTGIKGIVHTVAAGLSAFVAVIIFNPFHLTNLTHTFVISVSKHAEMWRSVNEWHPGFEWTNPVGTGFPLLIMVMLSIALACFWLFSLLLMPRYLTAPRDELDAQKRRFRKSVAILGWATAVFLFWLTAVSASLVEANFASFAMSVLFVAVLLLSIYKNIHWIYLSAGVLFIALFCVTPTWHQFLRRLFDLAASQAPKPGYYGMYIYPFLLLPAYVVLHIFVGLFSKKIQFRRAAIIFVIVTAAASIIVMTVTFNPLEFELPSWKEAPFGRIWHALRLSLSAQRTWVPKYEAMNPLSYKNLFPILYVINFFSVIVWLAFPNLQRLFASLSVAKAATNDDQLPQKAQYQLPKIDLATIIIAALTIYMAYRSRRFIPVAGIAACPVIAMLIDQIIRTISAVYSFHKHNYLRVVPMSGVLRLFLSGVGVVATLVFAVWWGWKFKVVYLDPWPSDQKLNSVFIRMTASHVKPFWACKFIRDNKLAGQMFNYWTEGGFIAWGQDPDPNTGRTPLQLFMDGRAQAAYEPEAYYLWSEIMSGGPPARSATIRKSKFTADDYTKIGQWIGEQLKKYNVWVVLMPYNQVEGPFVRGLEYNPNWQLVYYDNTQKLFVDVTTPKGKELFEGVFNGKTLYPDNFSRNLVVAHSMFLFGKGDDAQKKALEYVINAFKLNPSVVPMQEILAATKFPALKNPVSDFCNAYIEQYSKNELLWEKQDAFHSRTAAALLAVGYLQNLARKENNDELVRSYEDKKERYDKVLKHILDTKRW
jgi:hypothetical protein